MNKLSHKIILFFAFLGLFIVCAGWSDGVREERSVTPVSFNLSPHEALLITYDTTVGTEHRYYTAWLSGQTPHEAFLAAKSAVRQVMEEPLYWAGFIMLD